MIDTIPNSLSLKRISSASLSFKADLVMDEYQVFSLALTDCIETTSCLCIVTSWITFIIAAFSNVLKLFSTYL